MTFCQTGLDQRFFAATGTPNPTPMNAFRTLFLTGVGCALLNTQVVAADVLFTASITHDQEVTQAPLVTSTGQPRSLSYGSADFVLNDARTAFTFTASIYNIDVTGTQTADSNDNLLAAHIHNAPAGTNGGVRWGFFGTPDNDNSPDDLVVTPFVSGVGGTFSAKWDLGEGNNTTLTDQLPNILANNTYINFHTGQFAGGEIRGQITRVPDGGSTLVMFGVVLTGLLAARRKILR